MPTVVARFEITYVQWLDHYGELSTHAPAIANDRNIVLSLYRSMVLSRLFDKKAIALQRTGKIGTYPPIHGQEAISSAIGLAMRTEDVLVPYYRDYAAQLQRGMTISDILRYWNGDERGSALTSENEDLPICVPIASQCLHAAGVAFAFKYREQARVAVVTIGDGGTSEGDFYEAMNAAGTYSLPVVFVVNNNQWAISVPITQQTKAQTIAQKAIAAGFQGIQVDGNDALATLDVISAAIEKARRGQGPTLIEALSYRLSDHTTADDAKRYQPENEVKQAADKEPIQRFKHFLQQHHSWSNAEEQALQEECTRRIEQSVEEFLNTPVPTISDAFDYQFATLPDYLIEQRATAMEEVNA